MKKYISILLLLVSFHVLSQEKITITYNNLTKKEVILALEKKTNYKFYFIDSWLDDSKISGAFKAVSIDEIIKNIVSGTSLNYYIQNEKVIITKGNLLRKSLYDEKEMNTNTKEIYNPIYIEENSNNSNDVISIGKESLQSQQKEYKVSGTIKNNETGKPIEGLVILERSKNISTTTNKDGFFNIKLPYGQNTIETQLLGYATTLKKLVVFGEGALNFTISEESEMLNELIITTKKENNIKEVIAGITQINIEDIKNIPQVLGERDILKVATTLPGIKSAGEGAEGVNVRGGKVDQNLFLLDESVMYNPAHFLGLFSAINPFTTNDLKVYKGNIPAEYGGRISSVFDISTKDASTEEFKGEVSLGVVTSNVSLEIPIVKNKSGLLLGFRSTYSNWILKSLNDKSLNNSSASFYDVIAKYNHTFDENNSLRITGYHSNDNFRIASDTTNTYGNTLASINWSHKFNDKNHGNLILSSSNYSFNINFESEGNNNFDLKYTIDEIGAKLKMRYSHSKQHTFDYGISSKLYNVAPGSLNPTDQNSIVTPLSIDQEKGLESALFVSDIFEVNKKLSLNLGVRYSVYLGLGEATQRFYPENSPLTDATLQSTQKYGNNEVYQTYQGFEYRLSGRYFLNPELSLKASFNKTFQFIHRLSNNTSASPTDAWKLSDVNIKPQEAIQASLGIFKNFDVNEYELSLEGYYKDYQNMLDYKVGANFLLNERIETQVLQGPGKSYGIEFLAKKNVGKLNGWLGYSYSRSFIQLDSPFNEDRINNGEFFPTNFDKPHDVNLIVNYKLTKRFSLSSNFTYQTGRPITYPTGKYIFEGTEYVLYSDRNKFRIPDYYRLDVGLNIEGNHKVKKFAHSFWNISIYNVLGRNNPFAVFFVTENGNVKAYQSSIFATPIPTITYNFKF
ncbi:TonB-dependent receptor [Polaribacter litorisediminis]|uniref:TonB-dependent receptor n=1 Tax=Polaribacter litorisediminis TaxID=1908341 RepID=UPI001CBAEA48|nr:TonB-dependent receptor [Polaribacter litorisediminis]UAM96655.1 TonB-dependent receptor [Polaribacter litorisediminis]